jgi:hypothetical protein
LRRAARDLANDLGDEHLAVTGGIAQAARDVYWSAVEITTVGDRLAGVDPNPQLQAIDGGTRRVLHVDGAADRGGSARERDHQPVACGLDLVPVVRRERSAQEREVLAAQRIRVVVAVAVEQRRRPDEVGEQDRYERGLHRARPESSQNRGSPPGMIGKPTNHPSE